MRIETGAFSCVTQLTVCVCVWVRDIKKREVGGRVWTSGLPLAAVRNTAV